MSFQSSILPYFTSFLTFSFFLVLSFFFCFHSNSIGCHSNSVISQFSIRRPGAICFFSSCVFFLGPGHSQHTLNKDNMPQMEDFHVFFLPFSLSLYFPSYSLCLIKILPQTLSHFSLFCWDEKKYIKKDEL